MGQRRIAFSPECMFLYILTCRILHHILKSIYALTENLLCNSFLLGLVQVHSKLVQLFILSDFTLLLPDLAPRDSHTSDV